MMGIYIPEEFPKSCNDCPCTSGWNCFADEEMRDIEEHSDNQTKPDWCPLVEVKRGKWEVLESFSDPLDDSHKDRCRCTNCGFIHVFTDFHYGQYNFCPECGARMDGE